jgi:outer membrane protein, heavy metal efflux system
MFVKSGFYFKKKPVGFLAGVVFLLSLPSFLFAQLANVTDTIQLSLPQAEQQFLQNNLALLSQRYNISASRAYILQARLWPNPNINLVQGLYDPRTGKSLEMNANGEQAVQIQQLILLAGKINKQVKIAETNADIAELTFYDLLRTLKFTLRNDFYTIYFLQRSARVYDEEIRSLERISAIFDEQQNKGYIARSEVVRVKAQLYNLRSELTDLINQIKDKESEFRLVLQARAGVYLVPQVDSVQVMQENPQSFALKTLLDSAYQNRADLKIARANVTLSQQNYAYQKALAVPDLTAGFTYDRNGSYTPNANLLSLGFNIPLFNKNQGNIRAFRSLIDASDLQLQNTTKTVEEQVYRAYERALDADKLFQGMDKGFTGEFTQLAQAVLENYQRRNISLLDFLNFYDSYKQYMVQQNYILSNRVSALENINFLTGTNFYNK